MNAAQQYALRVEWQEDTQTCKSSATAEPNRVEPYPLPFDALEAIVNRIDEYGAAFISRVHNETVGTQDRNNPIDVDPPKRLCGHVYGPGNCREDYTEDERTQFHTCHRELLVLSTFERPGKKDLQGFQHHLKLFHFIAQPLPAVAAPCRPSTLTILLLFSLKVDFHIRQVWLLVSEDTCCPAIGSTIEARWQKGNITYDYDISHKLRQWDGTRIVHCLDFKFVSKDLKTMTILHQRDVTAYRPARKRSSEAETDIASINVLGRPPKRVRTKPNGTRRTR